MNTYRIIEICEKNGALTEVLMGVTDDILNMMRAIGICGDRESVYKIYKNGKLVMISKHLGA